MCNVHVDVMDFSMGGGAWDSPAPEFSSLFLRGMSGGTVKSFRNSKAPRKAFKEMNHLTSTHGLRNFQSLRIFVTSATAGTRLFIHKDPRTSFRSLHNVQLYSLKKYNLFTLITEKRYNSNPCPSTPQIILDGSPHPPTPTPQKRRKKLP